VSRDPIAEKAFLSQYARHKPRKDALSEANEALFPAYLTVGNDTGNNVDPFGLWSIPWKKLCKEVCEDAVEKTWEKAKEKVSDEMKDAFGENFFKESWEACQEICREDKAKDGDWTASCVLCASYKCAWKTALVAFKACVEGKSAGCLEGKKP
jgi:hypothetical protein